ncbi:MAG: response regulator [Alphaproteobacteria bacterium]
MLKIHEDIGISGLRDLLSHEKSTGKNNALIFNLSCISETFLSTRKKIIMNFINNEFRQFIGHALFLGNKNIVIFIPLLEKSALEKIQKSFMYFLSGIDTSEHGNQKAKSEIFDLNQEVDDFYAYIKKMEQASTRDYAQEFKDALTQNFNKKAFQQQIIRRKDRRTKIILIIEDQIFSQKVLENIIEGDYSIKKACDATEGIKMYLQYTPDICFLDWMLPGIDGIQFLDKIKEIDPGSFIIMSTSNNTTKCVQTAVSKGVDGYISKPFNRSKVGKYLKLFQQKRAS